MRKFSCLVGLTLILAWAGSAHAQSPAASSSGLTSITNIFKLPSTMNINVTPNIANNSAMDYRNQSSPVGGTYYRANTTGTAFPFTLSSMFFQQAGSNTIASTTTAGHSIYPTPAQMQAAAPSYLAPFQMYRGSPISR